MLIPLFSFRERASGLCSAPIAFKDAKEASAIVPKAVEPKDPGDMFSQVLLVAEFDPETGECFSVGEDVSGDFDFLNHKDLIDPNEVLESEVFLDEKKTDEESFSEEIPEGI